MHHHLCRLTLFVACTSLACHHGTFGQHDAPPGPSIADESPLQEKVQDDPLAIFRAPLLREGTFLVDAKARVERDKERGWWKAMIDPIDANHPPRELLLLPCTQLAQIRLLMEASKDASMTFRLTGRVFVYRARNYLLPSHAVVFASRASQPPEVSSKSEGGAAAANPAASVDQAVDGGEPQGAESPSAGTSAPEDDSVEDIMRNLEKAAGPVTRSPEAMVEDQTAAPSVDQDNHRIPASARLGEESSIVNRRGKITRDEAGGWLFVFDADASGLADPPLRLLPCLLLERIEDYARRQGNNSPALLSGTVFVDDAQNYLLPTVFRIPAERRNLSP